MRPLCSVVLLCLALTACSGLSREAPRVVSQPPTATGVENGVVAVSSVVKWNGPPEASPVRQAHLLAPGDWIVCARSGARDLSPPYAIFFNGDALVNFRIAVELEDCMREPYALVIR
jgi:hypothetical protein